MNHLPVLGWREWVGLPSLGIPLIKAKVDTGARTSCLHAFVLEEYRDGGAPMLRFSIHPVPRFPDLVVTCAAPLLEHRFVTDSGGHRENRPVIVSTVRTGATEQEVELTLTNRDTMRFRMLLGRTTLTGRFLVDASQSYLLGQASTSQINQAYF